MFVNVLRKIEIEHSEFQLHKSSRSLFSLAFFSFSFFLPSCSFSSTSVFSLIFLFAFVASSGDRLLISPDGLLSLWDVMESFRCVSRIARRFSILPILLHPLLPSFIHSFSLSLYLSSALGATDWPAPPSSTTCFPQHTQVCVGSRLGGTNRENTRENAEDEEKDEGGFFLFQERSFEYEYALIDS